MAYNEPMRPVAQPIRGRHHLLMKRIRAMARCGELLDEGEILLETPNLIEDALASGIWIQTVLIRAGAGGPIRGLLKKLPPAAAVFELEPSLFSSLTTTETSPGILALARAPAWQEADLFAPGKTLILVLAGLQDPGNLGTILRAAEAFGATGVLTTKGTVSPFNAKAIRAAAGSLLRLPLLLDRSVSQVVAMLRRENVPLLVSVARGGKGFAETDVTRPVALALGSEGAGLPRELEDAGIPVSIPMAGRVESLNVATATAVLLYEIARRRGARYGP